MDFLLLIVVLVAVFFQSRTREPGETQTFSFAPRVKPVPERLRSIWWVRQLDRAPLWIIVLGAVLVPLIITQPSRHLLYGTILAYAIIATSLNILTGWAGQLSLGQMAFAGIGAFLAAAFSRGITGTSRSETRGCTRPVSKGCRSASRSCWPLWSRRRGGDHRASARSVCAGCCSPSSRSRSPMRRHAVPVPASAILTGGLTRRVPFPRTDLFGIDSRRSAPTTTSCLAVLVAGVVMVGLAPPHRGIGRTTIAVRDNPDTAAAYTVVPACTKLRTFAFAGGIAGLGGALLARSRAGGAGTRRAYFTVDDSLIARVDRGHRRPRLHRRPGARRAVGGRPARLLPRQRPRRRCSPRASDCSSCSCTSPAASIQIGVRGPRRAVSGWRRAEASSAPRPRQRHVAPRRSAIDRARTAAGRRRSPRCEHPSVTVRFGGTLAVDDVVARGRRRRDRRPDRHQRRGQVDAR